MHTIVATPKAPITSIQLLSKRNFASSERTVTGWLQVSEIPHINEESHRLLDDWLVEHKRYGDIVAEENYAYFEKLQIIFESPIDPRLTMTAYYDNNLKRTKMSAKQFDRVQI